MQFAHINKSKRSLNELHLWTMASDSTIISQIEKTVGGKYLDWKIGITDDPAHRKAQFGNPLSWLQWKADSEQAAQNVERYFSKKGMISARKASKSAKYVYILLKNNPN